MADHVGLPCHRGATQSAHSATKAAQIGIARTLAKAWAHCHRVNVNRVGFWIIDTRPKRVWTGDRPARIAVARRDGAAGFSGDAAADLGDIVPLGRAPRRKPPGRRPSCCSGYRARVLPAVARCLAGWPIARSAIAAGGGVPIRRVPPGG